MAKGEAMEMGALYWPTAESQFGDEFCGEYLGLFPNNFDDAKTGKKKESAHFKTKEGVVFEVSAGQIVAIWSKRMEVGKVYWLKYTGKEKLKGFPQPARQFDCFADKPD